MATVSTQGRLIYIEPNDLQYLANGVDASKVSGDNITWRPEDLNMSVDLQVVIPDRNDCGQISNGSIYAVEINAQNADGLNKFASFFEGSDLKNNTEDASDNNLTTDYLNATYSEIYRGKKSSKESLGIESIDITFDSHFYPQVNIKFVDVRGFSLMMPTEEQYRQSLLDLKNGTANASMIQNFFRALFHFPYPRFLLTVKGFYGSSVTFTLAVNEYKTAFNSATGNFDVNVSFIGYMYGLYTDIPLNVLIAAPYYDTVTDSSNLESETTIGQTWTGKNYLFANDNGGDGGPICTFVEYLKKCAELNRNIRKTQDLEGDNETLNDAEKNLKLKQSYNDIKSDLDSFKSSIININSNNFDAIDKAAEGDNGGIVFLAKDNAKGEVFNIDVEGWNKFVDDFNRMKEELKGDFITSFPINATDRSLTFMRTATNISGSVCTPKQITNGKIELLKQTLFNPDGTEKNGQSTQDTCSIEKYSKTKQNAIRGSKFKSNYCIYIPIGTFYDEIDKKLSDIATDTASNASNIEQATKDMYNDKLGFIPTMNNMFRMTFAHIDCFMEEFYSLLYEIKQSNRRLKDFGWTKGQSNGGINGVTTDLNRHSDGDSFVPPFPGIYVQEDGKNKQKWPGDIPAFANIPEVKFVEKFADGIIAAKHNSNKYILDETANQNWDAENTAMDVDNGDTYNYTSITDYYHSDRNPYRNVDEGKSLGETLWYFGMRYASSKFQVNTDVESSIGTLEAENFVSVHKKPTDGMMADMKAIISSPNKNAAVAKILNDYGNKGNFACQFSFNSDKSKVYSIPKDTPLISSSVKFSNDGNIYPLRDSVSKYLISCGVTTANTNKWLNKLASKYSEARLNKLISRISSECFDYNTNAVKDIKRFGYSYLEDSSLRSDIWELMSEKTSNNFYNCVTFIESILFSCANANGDRIVTAKYNGESYIKLNFNDTFLSKTFYVKLHKITAILYGSVCYAEKENINFSIRGGINNKLNTYFDTNSISSQMKKDLASNFENFYKNEWPKYKKLISDENNYTKGRGDTNEPSGNEWEMKPNLLNAIKKLASEEWYMLDTREEVSLENNKIPLNTSYFVSFIEACIAKWKELGNDTLTDEYADGNMAVTPEIKLSLYNTFKNLYDKWLACYSKESFMLRSPSEDKAKKAERFESGEELTDKSDVKEFDNFLFVDSFYNDLAYKYDANPKTVSEILTRQMQAEDNFSVYEFMAELAQKNRMLFLALPVYNNYYSEETIKNIFSPQYSKTMVSGYGSTYLCMFTYEVSHVVDDGTDTSMCDDGFDIADITSNPSAASVTDAKYLFGDNGVYTNGMNVRVPAFGVTYARQNQSYFNSINIDMDNPRVTDYSIANTFALGNLKKTNEFNDPYTIANDIYSIYANRSYNCKVEMMGCANIMPMMYFQLNNIPMFRGAYMITNVDHHIGPGVFTTSFTGVRISKNQIQFNYDIFNLDNLFGIGGMETDFSSGGYSADCDNFNPAQAVARMDLPVSYNGKTATKPHSNRHSFGICAYAVQQYLIAGGMKNIPHGSGYAWATNGSMSNNFKHLLTISTGTSPENRGATCAEKCIAGDIAVMKDPRGGVGHVEMYDGMGSWVSDFSTLATGMFKGDPWVYTASKPNPYPIEIYRVKGCEPSNYAGLSSGAEKENGKTIMLILKKEFGFTNEQVIGIGSAIYQESHWNPKSTNSASTAAGICQWLKGRQATIVRYINSRYNTNYTYNTHNGGQEFTRVPFGHQIEGLIYELKETSWKKAIAAVKRCSTAEEAADAWTRGFEGVSGDAAHRKWISTARNALS